MGWRASDPAYADEPNNAWAGGIGDGQCLVVREGLCRVGDAMADRFACWRREVLGVPYIASVGAILCRDVYFR